MAVLGTIYTIGTRETHLYFYYLEQALLQRNLKLDKEAIQSLNVATTKMNSIEFLETAAPFYLSLKDYKKAEFIYSKIILHAKYSQRPKKDLDILLCYIGLKEKEIAKTMFYCVNEIYKREEYNQKKFHPKFEVNGITSDIFSALEQKYPELKQLRDMGIFNN